MAVVSPTTSDPKPETEAAAAAGAEAQAETAKSEPKGGKGKSKAAQSDDADAVARSVASTEVVEPIREANTASSADAFDIWENSGNGETPIHGDCIIHAPDRVRIPAGKRVRLLRSYRRAIGDEAPNHLKFIGEA